jgi:rare lipoprotein A
VKHRLVVRRRRVGLIAPATFLALALIGDSSRLAVAQSSGSVSADTGLASFYARRFSGRKTASGERLNNRSLTAAHPTLPLGSIVRVTNLDNGRTVEVRIVDRGPAASRVRKGYIIDLSRAAARALAFRRKGRARVRVEMVRGPPS